MLSLFFGGGKRARPAKKNTPKPPKELITLCKKYRVKITKKVGGRRVYRDVKKLAKMCLAKKMKKEHKKMSKTTRRRRAGFGVHHAVKHSASGSKQAIEHAKKSLAAAQKDLSMAFGRRKAASKKVSKAQAMKAFRSFYKRYCAVPGRRMTSFGRGGNPPLAASMGYEFCPSGMGGVLGANSTGMFPSPCTAMNSSQAAAEASVVLPSYNTGSSSYSAGSSSYSAGSSMGRRRRAPVMRRRRRSSMGSTCGAMYKNRMDIGRRRRAPVMRRRRD